MGPYIVHPSHSSRLQTRAQEVFAAGVTPRRIDGPRAGPRGPDPIDANATAHRRGPAVIFRDGFIPAGPGGGASE